MPLGAFAYSFVQNGYTLAYGDASAHKPHFHMPQLYYCASFIGLFDVGSNLKENRIVLSFLWHVAHRDNSSSKARCAALLSTSVLNRCSTGSYNVHSVGIHLRASVSVGRQPALPILRVAQSVQVLLC